MSFLLSYGRKFQHFLGKTPRVSRPFEPSPLSVIFLPREPRSHSPAAARPRSLVLPARTCRSRLAPGPPPGPRRNARRPLFPRLSEAKRQSIVLDLSNK